MPKLVFFILVFTFCFACSFVNGQNKSHSQANSNGSNNQQSQANQNITITEPVKVSLEPDKEQIESEKGYKTRQEKRDEANATWSRTGIVVSSLLFILVLIQAIISHRQLKEMKAQAKAMQDGLKETRKIIEQNERAVKASEMQATTSERTVAINEETFYLQHRAFMQIKDIRPVSKPVDGQPFEVYCTIYNKGRTPAKDISASISYGWMQPFHLNPETPTIHNPTLISNTRFEEIVPQESVEISENTSFTLSHKEYTDVMNKVVILVIDIVVQYVCIYDRREGYNLRMLYVPEMKLFSGRIL